MGTKQLDEPSPSKVRASVSDPSAMQVGPTLPGKAPDGPSNSTRRRLQRPAGAGPKIAWRYAGPIAVMHLLALLAFVPWLFSWTGAVLFLVGVYVLGGLGINIGYHRLLAHRSFHCPRWLERFFVVIAVCCMEDAPALWVAAHRLHHKDSDERPDPHSPLVNFFWGHIGWMLFPNSEVRGLNACDRYARDILRDPFYMWLQRGVNVMVVYFVHALLVFLVALGAGIWMTGSTMGGLQFGLSLLVWGVILRTVVVWHITWSVNSLTHMWGYRSYDTGEESRNNWFVALVANGEGWHNNHHAEPASASNWHRWWEFDAMWIVIRGLERVGLAWNVIYPRRQRTPLSKPN